MSNHFQAEKVLAQCGRRTGGDKQLAAEMHSAQQELHDVADVGYTLPSIRFGPHRV
jgi:hypothetical protein